MWRQRFDAEKSEYANAKAEYLRRQVRSALDQWRFDQFDPADGKGPQYYLTDESIDRIAYAMPQTHHGLLACGVAQRVVDTHGGWILRELDRIRERFSAE